MLLREEAKSVADHVALAGVLAGGHASAKHSRYSCDADTDADADAACAGGDCLQPSGFPNDVAECERRGRDIVAVKLVHPQRLAPQPRAAPNGLRCGGANPANFILAFGA